jgi:CRISPR-associated protein Csx3
LPTNTPLALYGVAPNWVYATVAAATYPQTLYQFDPALPFGWIQPLAVEASQNQHPDAQTFLSSDSAVTILKIQIPNTRLEYFQTESFPLPHVPSAQGLIIDGRIPYWLLTAVIRHFRDQCLPWLATYYAPLSQAVVVYSRTDKYHLGDLIAMPTR